MYRNWINIFSICVIHPLAFLGFIYPPRLIDVILFLFFFMFSGFGLTVGYHRLLTHRSFTCSTWLKRLLTWMGASALQIPVAEWVGSHRLHHKESDLNDDPHTPNKGFFYSHIGWFFAKRNITAERELARNILKDPFVRFVDKFPILPWLSTAIVCFTVAGSQGVLWGVVIKTVLIWHVESTVNSICHTFGSRPYETDDKSRNVWWLSILTLGEAWHNNHHYNQSSAFHGFEKHQLDLSAYVIRILEKLGLAWDVKKPKYALGYPKHISVIETAIPE